MRPEQLIYREEVTALLFGIADINVTVREIRDLIEENDDGEEELPEDDA